MIVKKQKMRMGFRRLSIVLLSAATITFGITFNRTTAQVSDEAAVHEVLLKSAIAFEKNDVDLITTVWGNDESVTVFESGHAN